MKKQFVDLDGIEDVFRALKLDSPEARQSFKALADLGLHEVQSRSPALFAEEISNNTAEDGDDAELEPTP